MNNKPDDVDLFLEAGRSFADACSKAGGNMPPITELEKMTALEFMKMCARNYIRFYYASASAEAGAKDGQ